MIRSLLKNPWFMMGASFMILMVVASLVHAIFFDSVVPEHRFVYKNDKLVAFSPLSPAESPPFGSNAQGESMFFRLLMGAKYTIGMAVVVAALRLAISIVIGLFYGSYFMRVNRFLSRIIESFHYVPMALLAYILLAPVVMQDAMTGEFAAGFGGRVLFEVIILTVIALPTTSLLIGNETSLILRQEFMTGVRVMGASRFHILRKHVMPHLIPKLWIQFAQQVIQMLILLVHLGVLQVFFGGTRSATGPGGTTSSSFTGEWSGVIGSNIRSIDSLPWVVITPLVLFALTILAMNLILQGLKEVLGEKQIRKIPVKKAKRNEPKPLDSSSFDFIPSVDEARRHR